jgi:hypothetical protein
MTAVDRQIRRHGQFLAGANAEQGAIVANAQAYSGARGLCCASSNLADQSQFSPYPGARDFTQSGSHLFEDRPNWDRSLAATREAP